jgi:hypothetical protein
MKMLSAPFSLRIIAVIGILLQGTGIVIGQEQCVAAADFCTIGVSVRNVNGDCTEPFLVCDDQDLTTEDTCNVVTGNCMQTTQSGATVCTESCEPDCVNKEYVVKMAAMASAENAPQESAALITPASLAMPRDLANRPFSWMAQITALSIRTLA